jgi:hypothetical protein
MIKNMFLPDLMKEIKHIEIIDEPLEEGGKINKMTIDNTFPDVKAIKVSVSDKGASLDFPNFSTKIEADITDPMGSPAQVSFSVGSLSLKAGITFVDDKTVDVDFSMDVKNANFKVHTRQPVDLLEMGQQIGMSQFEH